VEAKWETRHPFVDEFIATNDTKKEMKKKKKKKKQENVAEK